MSTGLDDRLHFLTKLFDRLLGIIQTVGFRVSEVEPLINMVLPLVRSNLFRGKNRSASVFRLRVGVDSIEIGLFDVSEDFVRQLGIYTVRGG